MSAPGPYLRQVPVGGIDRRVEIRVNRRARRMILRLDSSGEGLRLTLPPGVSLKKGLSFVQRQENWLARRLQALPEAIPFADGVEIPILDQPHIIRHRPDARRGVWQANGELHVSGQIEHLSRRVRDFLIAEARREIRPRVEDLATQIGRQPGRITLRDTRSRWGSCSARGDLNFCWRLILGPERALQYVVAHEVAHLVHLDHSAAFWSLTRDLMPDMDGPRQWLRTEGARLHRYG